MTDRALVWVERLGERLLRDARENATPPDRALAGTAGLALAFRGLAQATGDARYRDAAFKQILRAAQCSDRPSIGLFTGISGLRAVCALYAGEEPALRKLVQQCDEYVESQLPAPETALVTTSTQYDVIGGWSGALLARTVDGPRNSDRILDLLAWLLADDTRWRCVHPMRPLDPPENDLGMAHGIAGVLATVALATTRLDPAVQLLARTQAHELRKQATINGPLIGWPMCSQRPAEESHAAWCYGTAGIAAGLYWSADRLADDELSRFALSAMESQARRPPSEWGLRYHGLCHGTLGNALVYASVGRASGSQTLLDAVDRAVEYALDGIESADGACWAVGLDAEPYDSGAALDGAAGIALALATLTGDADSLWMRCHGLEPLKRSA